jgi:tetratricopeptide (TPR) repeat protein
MSDTSTTDLVQQGLAAARVGDIEDARRLLQEATQRTPDNVEAWLGLAGAVESLAEKEACFSKVLTLDPDNSDAKAGLALVRQKMVSSSTGHSPAQAQEQAVETEQEDKYYSGGNLDYVIAGAIALPLSLIAAGLFTFILGRFGFFVILIGLFAAPAIAGFIAEAVRWGVGKRRSRYLGHVVAACIVLGTAPFLLLRLMGGDFFALLAPGIFIFLGTATVLARLR